MKYEQKTCPFCQNFSIKKYGLQNQIQCYKFKIFCKTFTLSNKLNASQIWEDYTIGKQTDKQLAQRYHCFIKTIQRYIEKISKTALNPPENKHLNLVMDMTFFGRDFGVLVLMDSHTKKPVYHQIVSTEKNIYYKIVINKLIKKAI